VDEDGKRSWKKAGSMGLAGCFSFFPSKNLGGVGDGGMVVCNDSDFTEQVKIVRVHGGAPKYHHAVIGGNFRLDPVQAAVLDVKLTHLPAWHEARRHNAGLYDRLFAESGLVDSGVVQTPEAVYRNAGEKEPGRSDYHIYNQYVIRAADRDGLRDFLQAEGVGVEIYYPVPLHKQKCVAAMGLNDLSFPEAEKAARETLALPIYPELTDDMQQYVVDRIAAYYS
jgi:dTDP-4-amino-4,6-dideoxygalactose transaminase